MGGSSKLIQSLTRIFECVPLPHEILIHFDGGSEPTTDLGFDPPIPVRVLRSADFLGPGGGRHRLIKEASCDLVASFDDDSWPLDKDYFARALAVMGAFPNAVVLSPAVYLAEKPVRPVMAEVNESAAFEGSASITRRSFYLRLPGYVPVPQAYGVEEADVALQGHSAGFDVLSCAWLRAWHDRPYADNVRCIAPWMANEVLLAYLRFPRWLQPWGWWRAIRHFIPHWRLDNASQFLGVLARSPALCVRFAGYQKRYSWQQIRQHHRKTRRRWTLEVSPSSNDSNLTVTVTEATKSQRVLFVQYTNPAGYPPLLHASKILADSGAEVMFVGTEKASTKNLTIPPHPRIHQRNMADCKPGWRQKLHFLKYIILVLWSAWRFKASWLYVSDYIGCPPGLIAQKLLNLKVVYHEHDAQAGLGCGKSRADAFLAKARTKIVRECELVVAPNQGRLDALLAEFGRAGPSACVWNCPSVEDVGPARAVSDSDSPFQLVFQGSVGPERFPSLYLQALAGCPENVVIKLAGYAIPGARDYIEQLQAEAMRLGVAHRFEYLGTLDRVALLNKCRECDVGLCLLTNRADDINSVHMAGASNKPFEYLSQGLAVVVRNDDDWRNLFVKTGCGVASDIHDLEALIKTFSWLAVHRDEVRAMGETGRQQILQNWNYETVFAPVLAQINPPIP